MRPGPSAPLSLPAKKAPAPVEETVMVVVLEDGPAPGDEVVGILHHEPLREPGGRAHHGEGTRSFDPDGNLLGLHGLLPVLGREWCPLLKDNLYHLFMGRGKSVGSDAPHAPIWGWDVSLM